MLQTVEGIVDVDGQIRWLEPLRVAKPSRVLVTLLPDTNGMHSEPEGNIAALQAFLQNPEFVNRPIGSAAEIEARIQETRNPTEFQSFLQTMAAGSTNAPVLPQSANERAFYYEGQE